MERLFIIGSILAQNARDALRDARVKYKGKKVHSVRLMRKKYRDNKNLYQVLSVQHLLWGRD